MGHRQSDPRDPEAPRLSQRGLSRRGAKAYQVVLEAVLCVPAGALLGLGIDKFAETEPWGLAGGLALGFTAFVLNVVKLPGRLAAVAEDPDPTGNGATEEDSQP